MDPRHSAQDITRCNLCDASVPPMHCDICHINLCKDCVVDHLSDESKDHKVVLFVNRGATINYPKCQKHSLKICELHCRHCYVPICIFCVSSGDHYQHKKVDIQKVVRNKKKLIEKDLKELEKTIHPKYKEEASNLQTQKATLRKNSQKQTTTLDKQGKALYTEIDIIIQRIKKEISDIDAQHIAAIDKREHAINYTTTEIRQHIQNMYNLLDSDDALAVYDYISRNEEFRSLPAQSQVNLPTFTPQEINTEQIYQQIGSPSKLPLKFPSTPLNDDSAVTSKGYCSPIKTPDVVSSLQAIPLIDYPAITTEEYGRLPKKTPGVVIPPQARPLIDDPAITTEEYGRPKKSPGAVSTPQPRLLIGYQPTTIEEYCSPKKTPDVVVSPKAKPPIDDPSITTEEYGTPKKSEYRALYTPTAKHRRYNYLSKQY